MILPFLSLAMIWPTVIPAYFRAITTPDISSGFGLFCLWGLWAGGTQLSGRVVLVGAELSLSPTRHPGCEGVSSGRDGPRGRPGDRRWAAASTAATSNGGSASRPPPPNATSELSWRPAGPNSPVPARPATIGRRPAPVRRTLAQVVRPQADAARQRGRTRRRSRVRSPTPVQRYASWPDSARFGGPNRAGEQENRGAVEPGGGCPFHKPAWTPGKLLTCGPLFKCSSAQRESHRLTRGSQPIRCRRRGGPSSRGPAPAIAGLSPAARYCRRRAGLPIAAGPGLKQGSAGAAEATDAWATIDRVSGWRDLPAASGRQVLGSVGHRRPPELLGGPPASHVHRVPAGPPTNSWCWPASAAPADCDR